MREYMPVAERIIKDDKKKRKRNGHSIHIKAHDRYVSPRSTHEIRRISFYFFDFAIFERNLESTLKKGEITSFDKRLIRDMIKRLEQFL